MGGDCNNCPNVNQMIGDISSVKTALLNIQGLIAGFRDDTKKDIDNLFAQTRRIEASRLPCEAANDDDKCTPAKDLGGLKTELSNLKIYVLGIACAGTMIIEGVVLLIKYFAGKPS